MASFGSDFGQKVDLTASIRNILRNYPEGTAVLKELIQNADDAGAKNVSFCLDCRNHSTISLAHPDLQQFQGPALVVYNDAIFTEQDFQSIQRIGDSLKKNDESKTKIGRFGIGFNAVYHWTELPSFMSSEYLVMLDPQARFLPNVNPSNPGKIVNWVRDKELLTTFHDQFIPYKDHGGIKFQEAAPYQGTVFRLPLRTMEQAATSMLSKRSMSLPEATSLLQQLQQESSSLLLFLKNVESIELSIWSNNQSQPLVISGSSLVNATQIRTMRSSTLSQFNSADTSSRHVKPIFADYSLHVQCFHRDTHSNQGTEEVVSRYSEHWEICNQLGGTEATPIAQDSSNVHLRLIPWGGVAALISSTAPERSILKAEINNGVAYCFLSLPVQTSLPVMCNGFFELSSNRRDVWQDGADMTGDGMTRAKWNISLMSSVISPCYVRLLLRAKEILGFSEKFQHLWPSVGVPTPWTTIVNSMLVDAANYPLMYVQYELGDVSTLKTCNDNEAASTVKVKIWNDSQWINCKEALFFPMNASLTEKVSVVSNHDLMGRLLLSARKPFVQCSASLQTLLAESKICGQVADAKYVRKLLRDSTSKSNSSIKIDPREFLVAADKLKPGFFAYFVSFCCDDLSLDNILLSLDAPSATLTTAQLTTLSELNSLPLLPLSNSEIGYLRVFTKEQHSSISQLESMGFSSLRVISKLFSTGFQFDQALDELVGNKNKEQMLSVTLLCSETERQLFSNASNILLNPSLIGPRELKFLSHPVVQRSCNLRSFDKSLLNDVLLQILPSPCTLGRVISDADLITSDDMSVNDEFRDFLTALWKYLQNNPAMISALSELYSILPVINVMLGPRYVPYSLSSNALATEKGDLSLPESILKLVESTGVNLVDTTILSKVSSMPNVFWNSIHSPSRSGLLQAMYATIRDTNTSFSQMTDSDRDHLRLYLGSCESLKTMSHNDINLFRALPLFCLHRSKSVADASVSQYSSLNVSNKVLVNESRISEEMIPMNYVTYLTPQDLSLLEALQVTSIKKADFFVKELLPNAMQLAKDFPIEYSSTCVAMLSDLNSLALENKDFINTLKSSAFLISSSSSISPGLEVQLYKPCELFDPMDKELRDLLDVRFFPSEHFYKEESLVVLRSLGLQTSIEWPGVIACAEFIASIDDNYSSDGSESKSIDVKQLRAIALLQFLQKHISRLTTEKVKTSTIQSVVSDTSFKMLRNLKTLFTDTMNSSSSSSSPSEIAPELTTDQYNQILVSTAWLPVMATPINEFIPWMCRRSADKEVVFATPNKSRPISDIWICSASFHICKETVVSEKLQQVFGWTKPVPLKSVAIQLSEIASRYTELSSSESNNINSMRQQITTLVPQLYQRLNECTSEDGIEIRGILESACWVWVGDKFVSVDKIAVITSINASPYLYQLPQDLRVYRQLMTLFQLKKTFSARDYVYVLRQMAADQASTESSLPDHLIDLAVSLATLVTTEAGVDPHNSEVYLPDSNGKLRKSTDLTNDDVPWLSGPEYASFRQGCRILHPNISTIVADKLKVKSLRLSQLSSTANQSFFGDSSVNIEAFGQSESITNRLRTILDLYPDGSPIFSELIQNADDAGATVVRFLVDNQTYSVESLMDPKMAALQGPSLLVYNNAVFSEADFRNLARIGQASKIEKLATTGRFGLGFSSAYHISDTPSFVSGEHMVIFDPHCAYVPGANTNQPGLRVKFVGNKLTTLFKDQFQPFNYFGCDFNDSYPGTLFRFPLRTTSLARKSEISKRAYSVEEMTENLNSLARQFSNYLLFLRSVRTIEIYCRDADTGEVALLHSANAEVHNTRVTNDQALMRFFDKNHDSSRESGSDVVNTNIQSRDDFYSTLMSTVDAKLPSSTSIVIINIRSYFSSHVSEEIVSDSSESISLQSAERTPTSSQEIEFIVMVGLRGGAAKRMACSSTLRHLKLVPLGSVAACLRRKVTTLTPSTELVTEEELFPKLSGQVFCFLPLPINTQLPVHLNAYWELSSNRRDIWSGDDTTGEAKLRSDWNLAIMTDVLAPLYADLIVYLSKNQSNVSLSSCLQLLSLLPCPLPNTHWRVTASALFPLIRSEKLLYSCLNNGTTLSPQKCFIMEIFDDTTNLVAKRLESLLLLEKIPVVTVPVEVMKVFVDTGSVAGVVNPKLVRSYFNGSNLKVSTRYDPSSRQGFSFSSLQISGSILTRQDAFQNALFLLDVCMQEIKTDEYADLLNIPLVPLEDGCLGVIGSSIDIPLYLASDAERRLLTGSKSHLIVSEAVLGPTISVVFKNPVFHEVSNIRPLSSIDVLRLLKSTVPLEWFVESCTVVDYEDFVSTEWMICLWTYVLEAKCLPMYKDMLPILPVMSHCESINNIVGPKRSLAVKMVDSVPVMAYADLPMDLSNVLLSLGIYIFDINVLGRLSYENEITVHLLPQTGRGYLQAFQQIGINRLKQASSVWSPSTCDLFRNFILDTIVDKVDSISADEQTLLRSLSIWKGNSNTSLGHSNVHTPLEEKLLPPKGISADLLTGKYLSIRGDQDRKLYQLVGVQPEQSRTQFYMEHFIPQASAGAYDNSLLDSTVVNLVTHCSLFESECQGFKDVLGKSKLFRNAAGILVTATELYDPEVTSFISLLPPSMFPSVALTKYPSTLHMLRSLGMNIRMSIEGVLQAANAIPEDLNTLISSTSQDLLSDQTEDELETTSKLAKIRRRSTELLGYIDAHIEDLLECADPDSLSTLRERRLSGEPIFDMTVGADFGRELRSIQFVLCHTAKPISGPEQRALPWPEAIHKHPFAAPSQCASIDQLWLCSQSRRIVFSNIKSDLTRALFGWNEHTVISGRTVALQMIKLKDLYDDIVGSSAEQDSSLVPFFQLYQSLSLKFLEVLSSCFTSESESEVSFWLQALSGRSYLWVDKKFLETDKIAFSAPSNISLEPYFYLVPVQYQIYGDLLRAMGVKESFNPIDMMKTISELHKMSPNIQLPPAKHRMSIGVLKFIAKILIEQNRDMTKNSDDINAQVVGQIVDASLVSDSEAPVPVIATGTVVPASSESIPPLEPLFVLSISQLGEVFIPSDTGILYKASALTFDDAPWISSSIRRSSSGRSSSNLIFVCQDLSEDEAAVLGVKSLRKQLFTGDEIICPDANALKQMIAGDTFVDLLKDILVLADGVLRAKSLHIAFDERQHPTESLMNPGLSTTQGPSLVICIDGPVLSGETISQYLSMPTQLQGITQPVGSLSTIDTELKLYPKGGKRLVSSFVLTDNLQVISGNEFFLFDPTGDIILQDSASGKTKGVKRGKAQKANLTGRGQEEGILQQFPDQFSPFTTLPFGITPGSLNGFQGTMIRIPLRQKGSIVSQNVANVNDIKFGLRALKQLSECSLLFGSSLTNINCYHCLSSSTSATLDFQVSLASNPQLRNNRFEMLTNSGYKKTGIISSMFSTPFQPPQSLFKLSLSFKIDLSSILRSDTIGERTGEDHKQFGWLCWDDNTHKKHTKKVPAATNSVSEAIVQFSHDYLVLSSLGEGRCRDEACKEPFLSFEMRPFTTIAYRLVMDAELSDVSIAPDVGYLCCGGNPILPSGLPCHIEAQFLENTWDRSLPFPRVKDGSDNDVGSSTRKIKLSRQGASSLLTTIDIQSWNMSLFQTSVEILIPRMLQELLHGMSPRAVKAGFYKYWPYLDRSNSELIQMILTSNIHSHLANTGLYLTKNGFDRIESAVLPIDALRQDILRLLYDMLPLAQTPPELTRDLILSKKVKPKVLYPTRLRELLRANPSMSSNQPLITFEIAWALLAYCLTDLPSLSAATENEYHAKRTYKELIGCPLLPMADGSVRCFPKGARDQVFKLPAALHVILPSMMPSTIHLKIDSFSPLFGSKIFLESVNISESCLEILTEVGAKAFPPSWRRCDAVAEWSKPEAFRGFVGRGINPNQGPSLELLMYVIWKDLLQDQDINTFRSLGDWPLLPVVSNNRKMLLKSQYLPFVFYSQSTAQSDSDRDHIQRELGRLTSIATNSAESQLKQVLQEDAKSDNWAWIHERVTSDRGVLKPLPSVAFAGSNVLDTTLPEAVLVPLSPREDVVAEIQLQQEMQMEDITIDEIPQTREVSTSIYAILRKVGVPFLDFSVLKSPPDVINIDYLPVNSRPSIARRILNSLAYFTQNNVVVYKHTEGAGVSAADSDLLLYDSLSVKERGDLLEQIYLDHQLAPLSTSEISQLKTLRLFSPHISTAESTSLMRGSAVNKSVPAIALSDYKSGAYWCSSTHTFDGMSMLEFATDATSDTNSSLRSAGANMPAVLVDEERLRPLYLLLNVLELTPALAARQFILPTLLQHSISPTKKLVLMMNFANNWNLYKDDRDLIEALKEVHFIPSFSSVELHSDTDTSPIHRLEQTSTLTNTGAGPLRKASQVLSWEDSDLVALLRGRLESRYLPPPTLRSSTLLTMMIDLGTPKEITRDDVIRIALDIELIHKRAPIQLVNVDDNDLVSEAAEYGRRLLRYIREDSRCAALFNRAFGSRLSKIQFVPARIPIRVEHGAFVVFKQQLCCFNQLAAKQCGALVFCAKPVIDDDLSLLPHLYSFVGVMTDPTLDIVLAHLVKLTEQGESIDRWNNLQFSPEITFTAIFTFLFEHWKEIAMDKVAYLRSSAVIPVGHQLVPANRLFFKLVENLTPFMHEVPRVLGVHEEFLKLLKVRESPSVNDYTQFLAALAVECGDLSLNPNELRAVVTIIESIASLQIDNLSTNGDNFVNGLHLPDQNSILRPHASCIQNNDNWLKAQAGDRLMAHGLYIVHPWLPASAIKALYLPPISSILREVLLATNETSSLYVDEVLESMLQRFVRQLLSSDTVLNGLLELKLAESTTSGAFTTQEIEALLRQFSFRFVKSLPTTFIVLTSSLSLPPVALPTNATTTDSAVDTAAVISASNTSIPISKESQSLYFIQRIQDGGTVFVNLALLQPPLELITAVAAAVGDLLNLSHVFTATIAYLLSSTAHQQASVPSKREVDEQLNQIVTREPNDSQSVLTYLRLASDPVVMRERRRGMPGEKVSLCSRDLASLELKPFRLFQQGVTVAYAAPSESTTVSTDFRYGKVLIVGETSEEGIRRLIVKTGSNSSTQLLSSDVYSFKTTRDSKRQSQAIEERSRSPFSVLSRIAAPLMGNSTTRSSNGAALAETSLDHIATESGAQGGNTHSTAQQNDVLDALNTLLIRAGLGADINTQDLIKRAVDLSSSLRRTEKDLQEERLMLSETQNRLERATNALMCQICQERRVKQVLVPCGHILCEICSEQLRGRNCPFCRQGYNQCVNFYPPSETERTV